MTKLSFHTTSGLARAGMLAGFLGLGLFVLVSARADSEGKGESDKLSNAANPTSSVILAIVNPAAISVEQEKTSVVSNEPPRTPLSPAPTNAVAESPAPILKPVDDMRVLDSKRRFALGMIETGNNDRVVGRRGEVSRYQIMPTVWEHYSGSSNYGDEAASLEVAQQHWAWLHDYFTSRAGRAPTNFDMYVLWNTRAGYYASKGFDATRLTAVVRDRARRFVNLVERGEL